MRTERASNETNRGRGRTEVALALAFAASLAGCGGPRTFMVGDETFKRRPPVYPVDVYVGEVVETNRKIAIVESTAYPADDEPTRLKQIEEMKSRARVLGADAIEDLRVLTKRVRGFTVDERTPFLAWKQGEFPLYFMRGTAIAYESGIPGRIGAGVGYTDEERGFVPPERPDPTRPAREPDGVDDGIVFIKTPPEEGELPPPAF